MAIQIRRGNYNDFDPTRMRAGELAVCLDNGYVYATLSPGQVVRLGTAETIEDAVELAEAWAVGEKDGEPVPSTDPTYNNNSKYYSEVSTLSARDSEAYAIGKRNGVDVPSTDPAYHNNAKYYSSLAENAIEINDISGATDTRIGCQVLIIGGVSHIINGTVYMEKTQSVTANTDTTFTFTNEIITTDSGIDTWASIFGVNPKDVTVSNGTCDVVFNISETTILTCRIYIR